jgi:hypothetical protein
LARLEKAGNWIGQNKGGDWFNPMGENLLKFEGRLKNIGMAIGLIRSEILFFELVIQLELEWPSIGG